MKRLIFAFLIILSAACNNNEEKNIVIKAPEKVALGKSANSDSFNISFEALLNNYYALKASFVKEDTASIQANSKKLIMAADSLKIKELKLDENLLKTAKQNAEFISNEVKGLLGESTIEEKRRAFHLIGNDIFALIRTVHYDKSKVYFQHCPMAFKNTGADWLSASEEILNPFMPKQMLDCGVNKDSVDFRSK